MTTITETHFDDEIIQSLELAEESVLHFLTFMAACGFNKNHKQYKILSFLIQTKRDIKEWFKLYSGDVDDIVKTTDKFKANKIIKLNIDIDLFLCECIRDLKSGLELLFQVECSAETVDKIKSKLHSNELSLDRIYKLFKTDDWYNDASKIARSKWN